MDILYTYFVGHAYRKVTILRNETPVHIVLHSTIEYDHAPAEKTELHIQGRFYEKNGLRYLLYKEELPDIGTVDHTIKVGGGEGLILRKGEISMRQPLRVASSTEGHYSGPFGAMATLTDTDRCEAQWDDENGIGKIMLRYHLYLQGTSVGRFSLTFNLRRAKS